MIYEYRCNDCMVHFDRVKPVSQYDTPELCAECGRVADRIPFPRKVFLSGTAVQDKVFNHGLGTVCTNSEARQIAKERGLVEVGNERVEKHVKVEESNYDDIWKGA